MRIPPCALPCSRAARLAHAGAAAAVAGVLVAGVVATVSAPAADAATVTVGPKTTSVTVTWRGNGHGHGLSQYGARGAAAAGLSFRQIIAFYYPHTALVKRAQPTIRIVLAGMGAATTAGALPGLTVSGVRGTLPSSTSGIARYRLVADAHRGVTLQQLHGGSGAQWKTYRRNLPNHAAFTRGTGHATRIFAPDGSSNYYLGSVRAVRASTHSGGRINSVNVLGLERYTAGVAPREMPASWARAAVDSQAIAARTYARYAINHPRNRDWDICDTTACQFYGGFAYVDPAGRLVWHDNTRGVTDTSKLVAEYRGSAIFAQFSASNGGWTVAGGQPYLVARADPYDTTRSGDPYLAMSHKVTLAALCRSYGLSKITRILTATDGHGAWGGRTSRVSIFGVRNGKAKQIRTTGFGLADALGAYTDWYRLVAS